MLRLTGTVKLQVVLSGAATASRVTVSYMDFTATATTGGTQLSVTNGATPVDICDAPAASTTRQVDHVRLVALAAMTATFSVNDGTARDWIKVTLALGDTFDWSHSGGVKVVDANGNTKTVVSGAISATTLDVSGNTTLTGDLAVNGGDLTTSATTFNLLASPTTLNIGAGASVALNIGHASAAAAFAGGISIPTGKTLSGAGAINISGSVTAGAISGTTLSASGTITNTGTGDTTALQSTSSGTNYQRIVLSNTGGAAYLGVERSVAGGLINGDTAYDAVLVGKTGISFSANEGAAMHMRIASTGAVTIPNLTGTGTRHVVVDANGVLSAP